MISAEKVQAPAVTQEANKDLSTLARAWDTTVGNGFDLNGYHATAPSDAERRCITTDVRTVNCYIDKEAAHRQDVASLNTSLTSYPEKFDGTAVFAGIDTLHLWVKEYTVADNPDLEVQTTMNPETGENEGHPLYITSQGVIVEGKKAYHNNNHGLFRMEIIGEGLMFVKASLPKLLRENNTQEVNTLAQLHLAIGALERLLMAMGIRADLHDESVGITRIDLCRTVQLESTVPVYTQVIRGLKYPRTSSTHYKSGARWSNGNRQLCLYDKAKEQGKGDSKDCRLEYRLTRGRAVESTIGTKALQDILHPPHFKALSGIYVDATGRLLSADVQTGSQVSGVGIDAVVEALSQHRGGYTKALVAIALALLTEADTLHLYMDSVHRHHKRQRLYTVRKKLEKLQPYADLLTAASRTNSDLYAELKRAFTTQRN